MCCGAASEIVRSPQSSAKDCKYGFTAATVDGANAFTAKLPYASMTAAIVRSDNGRAG